jgi:hypothetical protein
MRSVDRVALALNGSPVVLQRVPRPTRSEEFAVELEAITGRPARSVDGVAIVPRVIRVLDGRTRDAANFETWDRDRASLASEESPLVVLLDVASAALVARAAPHFTSWASGIWMPAEDVVRPARSDDEVALGEATLRRALEEDPAFRDAHRGEFVGVDLLTGRLFAPKPDGGAIAAAKEQLDEGLLYLTRLPP